MSMHFPEYIEILGHLRQVDLDAKTGRIKVANAGNSIAARFECDKKELVVAFRWHYACCFRGYWMTKGEFGNYHDEFVVESCRTPNVHEMRQLGAL